MNYCYKELVALGSWLYLWSVLHTNVINSFEICKCFFTFVYMKILFLAPHLSTGGMPAFLLKRIETLQKYTDADVYVVEFKNYSSEYVVQKNKINKLTQVITLGTDSHVVRPPLGQSQKRLEAPQA